MRYGLATSLALVALSAAMAVAVFPPVGWTLLGCVAWIPLFVAVQGKSAAVGFRLGALHGVLFFAGTLNWLFAVFGAPAAVLLLVLAFFTALFGSVAARLSRLEKPRPLLVALWAAAVWTGCEFYRCEWFVLRFPWMTPGTGLPPNALTPVIGVYGVSFLVALAAAMISGKGKRARLFGGMLAAGLAVTAILRPGAVKPQEVIRVAAVQTEAQDIDACLRLSGTIPGKVDAIVWPEYALPVDLRDSPHDLQRARQIMTDKGAQVLVLANPVQKPGGKSENTALCLGLREIYGTHVKNRPVPLSDESTAGSEAPAIPTPLGKAAATICFDNDFEAVPRRAVRNGAEFFLIPSEDAKCWTEREHLQHALLVAHRAAETGRWMVVASSSGRTQIADPHGNVSPDVIPLMEEGVMVGEIARETAMTPYVLGGWVLGPVCVVIAAGSILGLLVRHFRQWRDEKRKPAEEAEEDSSPVSPP